MERFIFQVVISHQEERSYEGNILQFGTLWIRIPALADAAESQGRVEVAQSRAVPVLAGGPVWSN